MKPMSPKLAGLYGALQTLKQSDGSNPEIDALADEIGNLADALGAGRDPGEVLELTDLDISVREGLSGAPKFCPCCGQPVKEVAR